MQVHGGATDVTTYFVLRSTTDNTELTSATITNIDLQYVRSGVAPVAKVDATALAATDSAHGDNSAIEIDPTDQPGLYRVDWPDAAFAAGVKEVILSVKYSGAFTEHLRVIIDAPVNVTKAAGTAWASGAITAASIADGAIDAATFAADVDAEILSYIVDDATRIDASALNTLSGHDPGATLASRTNITAGTMTTTTNLTNLPAAAALEATSQSIKTKTDSLTFTSAGIVDANVQQINDVTITGDGSGTPFNV